MKQIGYWENNMLNKVELIGRLGQDVRYIVTDKNVNIAKFSVATTHKDVTTWHNITAFGKLAEICNQYLSKGRLVYISGRLEYNKWEAENGSKSVTSEIICNEMKLLDSKKVPEVSNVDQKSFVQNEYDDFMDEPPF